MPLVTFLSLQNQAIEPGGLPSDVQVKMALTPHWPMGIRRTKKLSITGGSGFRRENECIRTIIEIKKERQMRRLSKV